MDNETAKIGTQELDSETTKGCSPESEEPNSKPSEDSIYNPSAQHADTLTKGEDRDVEAAEEEILPTAVKIPRSQRRGLFGRFTVVAEVTEPKHYPRSTKWFLTFVIALAAVAAPLGSAIIFREWFQST